MERECGQTWWAENQEAARFPLLTRVPSADGIFFKKERETVKPEQALIKTQAAGSQGWDPPVVRQLAGSRCAGTSFRLLPNLTSSRPAGFLAKLCFNLLPNVARKKKRCWILIDSSHFSSQLL